WPPDQADVARRDVDHAVGDNGTGLVDRAAVGGDAVDGFELLVRVELPADRTVSRGVGAHASVLRSGKDDAGDRGQRRALRGAAAARGAAQFVRRWLRPDFLARVDRRRAHAALCGARSVDAEVDLTIVRGDAPLSAQPAAVTRFVLP